MVVLILAASFREQSRARKGAVQFRSDRVPMGWPARPPLSTAPLRARLCSRKARQKKRFFPGLAPRASINHSFPLLREALCLAAISANKILGIARLDLTTGPEL